MKDENQERWMMWMVQAQHFAERENYPDAVARMKLVHDEVAACLATARDQKRRLNLTLFLERVDKQLEDLRSQHARWRGTIAERRQATIDSAVEEFAKPLPGSTD